MRTVIGNNPGYINSQVWSDIKPVEALICFISFHSMLKVYSDTYRIVASVSRYVWYHEVPVLFHPLLLSFSKIDQPVLIPKRLSILLIHLLILLIHLVILLIQLLILFIQL